MSMVEKYNEKEVGFRFHPRDQELIRYYLEPKVAKKQNKYVELEDKTDIYAKEPWRLTHTKSDLFEPNEWYYFVTHDQVSENVTGKLRNSRKVKGETCEGCWKAPKKLRDVVSKDTREVIGKKRSLSFYVKGESKSSGWTMTEYYLLDGGSFQNQVLCHLKGP
ncbi:putative NAC domain-containing protein 94 [Capsella rubella]|nr:putative NAC domain-containing protein 94 [Capsella rubella]